MILKWTNKYSGETGYVKCIRQSKGFFESTADENEARKFTSSKNIDNALSVLAQIGETKNNSFSVQ